MKKFLAVLAAALALCLCFAAVACAGNGGSEKGEWKLEFFGDGAQNYSVGDVYGGETVEADYFECSFDGAQYKVFREGDIVMEGRYSAENIGEDSLLLSLETEGRDPHRKFGQGNARYYGRSGRAERQFHRKISCKPNKIGRL